MANYALSVLAKGQGTVTARNNSPEQRRKTPTVMELALKNQEFSIPNANDLRKSELQPVEIYYQKNVVAGSVTAKAAAHTGTYGDSGSVSLTYITHVEKIQLPRKIAQNNIITYQNMFTNLYEMKWKNLRTRHDTSALAFLYANRCQLLAAVIDPATASASAGSWSDANFAEEIDSTNTAFFMQRLKSFMAARYYTGPYDIVSDLQLGAAFEFAMQQGQANNANLAFQFANANIAQTQDVISSAYAKGCVLAMPMGSLSALQWNDPLNRAGVNSGENNVGMLGVVADPLGSGATADISMYTGRADTSANTSGGSTQDIVDEWEIALTIGYALPPLSTSGDSTVHLIGQV